MNALIPVVACLGTVAAMAGAASPRRARTLLAALLTIAAAGTSLVLAVSVLRTGHAVSLHSAAVLPVTGVSFTLDPLGALFTAVGAVVAVAVSIFAVGYAGHAAADRTSTAALPVFVTALLLVPAASSVATFLVLWELMAIASLLLVLTDQRRNPEARRAAVWYAVMTQSGAAAIILGLTLLAAHAGGQGFAAITAHAPTMGPALRSAAFLLTLAGFASKAGVVPLHVWLPRAHPEAPSPVSALMSAAMVNLGVYGIVRVGDTLLHGGPAWWWVVVLALGALSALYGAVHSATSTDLKRLLAYSTTDNVGLIMIGVGGAGLLAADHHPNLAALALLAALLQVVNHAMFKGSLFLSAGSIQQAAGARDLDALGGLLRRMPVTGAVFAVAALSISALPPLNGFVSEWLLLQSLLHGLASSSTAESLAMPVGVAALALTGGLTAAAFVKAFGVGMLGQPRTEAAARAVEPPATMWGGAGLLALACIALGVAPGVVLPGLVRAVGSVLPGSGAPASARAGELALAGVRGALAPAFLAAALVGGVAVVAGGRRLLSLRYPLRRAEAWGCGRELQTARMEYTATSFAEPLSRVFDDVVRPDRDLDVSHGNESRWFVQSITYRARGGDAFERVLFQPLFAVVRFFGSQARRLQNGSVHLYLAYGLGALLLILLVAR